MQDDFSSPCGWAKKAAPKIASAHGHFTQIRGGTLTMGNQSSILTAGRNIPDAI
jgi:hypothetical protein